jgi:TolB protein
MSELRRMLLAAAGLAVVVLGCVAEAQAVSPARETNGRIVFRRYLDVGRTSGAIFTVNPNGKHVVRVTRAGPGVIDTEPDWSADGSRIAFTRQTPCPPDGPKNGLDGTCDLLFTMRRDGSDLRQLVPCGFDAAAPSFPANCVGVSHAGWSPDGSKLAFQYNLVDRRYAGSFNVQAGIWIVDADGTNLRHVTQRSPGTSWDFGPQWSPDGTRLVFFRLDLPTSQEAVFTVAIDGAYETRVTPPGLDAANPNWSPDGSSILFNATAGDATNLYEVRADGTQLTNLTKQGPGGYHYLSASYSPDGMRIATSRTPGTGPEQAADVVTMRADGSHLRPVTRTRLWDSGADWGTAPLLR